MLYLTAPELAELCRCKPNQFALMARRLKVLGFPFEQIKGCCPVVLRSYHDQRMQGSLPARPEAAGNASDFTPNRAALQALQNKRHARKRETA